MVFVTFCLLGLLATTAFSIKNVGEVFKVDDRSPSTHPSSCNPYFDPRHAANSGSTKILNKIWDQLNDMSKHSGFDTVNSRLVLIRTFHLDDHTVQTISSAQYNEPANWVTRRILGSFFAIPQNQHRSGPTAYEYPDDVSHEPSITYRKKLRAVRGRLKNPRKLETQTRTLTSCIDNYKIFRNLINTATPDSDELKPKLFCDSTFMEIQGPSSDALDKSGKPILIKDSSGRVTGHEKLPAYAERKWAAEMGRNVFGLFITSPRDGKAES